MIIEFYGLPCVGKTTLAKEIARQSDFIIIKARQRWEIILYNFIFACRYPVRFWKLFFFVLKYAGSGPMFYYKLMNCFFVYNAKYIKACYTKKSLLDQGHIQNITSLFENKVEPAIIDKYLSLIPCPDFLFILEAEKNSRETRSQERGYYGREFLPGSFQEEWRSAIEYNHKLVKARLAQSGFKPIILNSEKGVGELAAEVFRTIKSEEIN